MPQGALNDDVTSSRKHLQTRGNNLLKFERSQMGMQQHGRHRSSAAINESFQDLQEFIPDATLRSLFNKREDLLKEYADELEQNPVRSNALNCFYQL